MPAQYKKISLNEFEPFVTALGFQKIQLPDVKEAVFGKVIKPNLCLRIYSSIVDDDARDVGSDAIRLAIFFRDQESNIIPVGKQKRVHRVLGWKNNLKNRIDEATNRFHETCHCKRPMVLRENAKTGSKFWGCIGYNIKKCSGTKPFNES